MTPGSSDEAQSTDVPPRAVPRAYAAIAEADPSAEPLAVEQDSMKDAAGAEQTKDDTEIEWYKDPVVSVMLLQQVITLDNPNQSNLHMLSSNGIALTAGHAVYSEHTIEDRHD